jgi:hypothetical protein
MVYTRGLGRFFTLYTFGRLAAVVYTRIWEAGKLGDGYAAGCQ